MSTSDKYQLQRAVVNNLIKIKRDIITDKELLHINKHIDQLSNEFIKNNKISDIIDILTDLFIQDFKKQKNTPPEPSSLDVHELLKKEIGTQPETTNNNLLPNESKTDAHNISKIFGYDDPLKLQFMFNPRALETKAYMILDRRYSSRTTNNTTQFRWIINNQGISTAATNENIIGTTAPLKDIIKMKVLPFIFPNTINAITGTKRLSVAIQEINMQSYSCIDQTRRFHFLFNIDYNTTSPNQPMILDDIGNSVAEYEFYKPIFELTSITLTFGNPFDTLSLDPDILPAIIAPDTSQTTLTFTQIPRLDIGDTVYISNFITTEPLQDISIINQVNSSSGWPIISIDVTKLIITINIDLTTLTGAIINNPYQIYLGSKRFVVPVEFTFRR